MRYYPHIVMLPFQSVVLCQVNIFFLYNKRKSHNLYFEPQKLINLFWKKLFLTILKHCLSNFNGQLHYDIVILSFLIFSLET